LRASSSGDIQQVPPQFSAVKDRRPAGYKLAREANHWNWQPARYFVEHCCCCLGPFPTLIT